NPPWRSENPIATDRRRWPSCAASRGSLELAIPADQRVGGAVVIERRLGRAFQLWNDALGERFAELDAPLIERVDLPDRALGKDDMLVQRDELAQGRRRQGVQQNSLGGTVSLEQTMRHQPIGGAFGLDLIGGLAEGQGLGLREDVGDEHV